MTSQRNPANRLLKTVLHRFFILCILCFPSFNGASAPQLKHSFQTEVLLTNVPQTGRSLAYKKASVPQRIFVSHDLIISRFNYVFYSYNRLLRTRINQVIVDRRHFRKLTWNPERIFAQYADEEFDSLLTRKRA